MRQWIERRPLLFAVGIALGTALLPVPLVWVLGILAPGTPEVWQRLVGVIILTAIVLALVARLGWWRESGLTPPAEWRQLPLYILPAVLICWPLLSGIRPIGGGELALLLAGYLLTGIMEETAWRGLALHALLPQGLWRAALVTSALFGLSHLGRLAFGSGVVTVLFQILFSAFQGVGFAALRLRTGTIWPLIGLHALADLFLQLTQVPQPLWSYLYLASHTILLVYGLMLLRGLRGPAGERQPSPA